METPALGAALSISQPWLARFCLSCGGEMLAAIVPQCFGKLSTTEISLSDVVLSCLTSSSALSILLLVLLKPDRLAVSGVRMIWSYWSIVISLLHGLCDG